MPDMALWHLLQKSKTVNIQVTWMQKFKVLHTCRVSESISNWAGCCINCFKIEYSLLIWLQKSKKHGEQSKFHIQEKHRVAAETANGWQAEKEVRKRIIYHTQKKKKKKICPFKGFHYFLVDQHQDFRSLTLKQICSSTIYDYFTYESLCIDQGGGFWFGFCVFFTWGFCLFVCLGILLVVFCCCWLGCLLNKSYFYSINSINFYNHEDFGWQLF